MRKIVVKPTRRWEVVFRDDGRWQAGIYVPEYTSREEIKQLEKHNVPELFLLISGSIVLVTSIDGEKIIETPMEPGVLYIIDEWHNAYRPGGKEGVALVIEGVDVETVFIDIKWF